MTRNRQTAARAATLPGHWALQDAKARFSEVVRKAKTEGPQKITVHGREEVVVISVEEYQRAKGEPTGEVLVKAMQDPRVRDLHFEHEGTRSPVRRVKL
jgi:prevent-host-death family protein